jgi:hypothetical protein
MDDVPPAPSWELPVLALLFMALPLLGGVVSLWIVTA